MTAAADRRIELHVLGRVQGVGFRWATCEQARRLGLSGWVRNEPDGSVRLLAQGPAEAVQALELWCAHGPARARVDHLERWMHAPGDDLPPVFQVRV